MRKSRVFILVFTISILVLTALCVGLVFAFLPKKEREAPSYAPSISLSPSQSPSLSSAPSRTKTYTLLKTFELVGERTGDAFGDSISMSADGSILAVGASSGELDNTGQLNIGWVKVYKRNEDNEMIPYGLPIYGAQNPGALFGYNLSLSPDGSTLAVAIQNAERDDGECCNYGRVIVYRYNDGEDNNEWRQIGSPFDGENRGNYLGRSLSFSYDGSILAIGGNRQVKVFIFDTLNKEWEPLGEAFAELISSRHLVSLSRDGLLLAIGTTEINSSVTASNVKVYEYTESNSNGKWNAYSPDDVFKSQDSISSLSLSADGQTLAYVHGKVMEIYQHEAQQEIESGGNWIRTGIIEFESPEDFSSSSLSLSADGERLVVGTVQGNLDQIQVYTFMNNEWVSRVEATGKNEFPPSIEEFGKSVAISHDGRFIAAGAPEASIGESGLGYVWIYEFMIV